MAWDYEFECAVRYLFCHRSVEFGLPIKCAVLNPIFCQAHCMQEYPINKHESTIIVNQYLVKGDWF